MQNSVPKFASFKPKPKSQPRLQETSQDRSSKAEPARPRHHITRPRYSEDAHWDINSTYNGHHADLHPRGQKHTERKLTYAHGYVEDLFKVDQQGDQDNAGYGTNSKWHVPAYREPREVSILGAERRRNAPATTSLLARLSRDDRARLMQDGRHIVAGKTPTKDQISRDLKEDYLPLAVSRKRKHGSPSPEVLGLSFRASNDRPTAYSGRDGESDSDGSSQSGLGSDREEPGLVKPNTAMHKQLAQYQDRVKMVPTDVETWLAYIDFQRDWVLHGLAFQATQSGKEDPNVTAKLQLAIIGDALKAVGPTHPEREALVFQRLNTGRRVWAREELDREWKDAVAQSHRSPSMLLGYIKYCLSTSDAFQFDFVKDLFIEIFAALSDTRSEPSSSANNMSPSHLDCVLMLSLFLRGSGFMERAVAVWQILIDLSNSDSSSPRTTSHDLESLWNAGGLRHGETGLENLQATVLPIDHADDGNKLEAWAKNELIHMSLPMLPVRTTDVLDDDDDLFRVVLYSEVQPYVEKWPMYSLPDVLGAFMDFCGLPPILGQYDKSAGYFSVPIGREASSHQHLSLLPGTSWPAYTDTMFLSDDDPLCSFKDIPKDRWLVKLAANVLEEITKRSVRYTPQKGEIPEYFMALTYHLAPKSARKMAKSLLEGGHSSCVRLYHSLALIEGQQKGAEAADRVFILALQMSNHHAEHQPGERLCLWGSWVRAALLVGDVGLALRRVVSIGLGESPAELVLQDEPSQSQILRTHDHLQRTRDEALSSGEFMVAAHAAQLLITLTHLTTMSISLTTEAFRAHVSYFERYIPAGSSVITLLHQHLAVLLYTRVTKRLAPYAPADLAAALLPSVAALPTNGLILNIYAALFRHNSRLDDRVRSAARQIVHVDQQRNDNAVQTVPVVAGGDLGYNVNASRSIVPHLFSIQTELSRMPELGSTSVSIRAAFERAVASPACAHSEYIWGLYLDYECSLVPSESDTSTRVKSKRDQSNESAKLTAAREKVKSVFYRGLSVLPWSKDWAMRTFSIEVLREALTTAEKQAAIEGMSERGLRLHKEIDELT